MRRHALDPFSLVIGFAMLIGAVVWVAWDQGDANRNDLLVAVPVILIVGGVAGIIASAVTAHRRKDITDE